MVFDRLDHASHDQTMYWKNLEDTSGGATFHLHH